MQEDLENVHSKLSSAVNWDDLTKICHYARGSLKKILPKVKSMDRWTITRSNVQIKYTISLQLKVIVIIIGITIITVFINIFIFDVVQYIKIA